MLDIREIDVKGYEKVIEAIDESSGLHAFIAIHNSTLGPALGGTRIYPYSSRDEALTDVLRLSKGMTYKSSVAEIGLGGGKSVVIADPSTQKTDDLLRSFGQVVDSLKGKYVCAEDVGSSAKDMLVINQTTNYVAALPIKSSSGDPSRFTAWGVFRGVQAVAQRLWNRQSLKGKVVAIQGLGHVGSKLADFLFWNGADLIISDVDKEKVERVALLYDAKVVDPSDYYSSECDILCPCAMGGGINEETIPLLKCQGIAGAANNQLLKRSDGESLLERGILYAPDFVINSGGVINVSCEFEAEGYRPNAGREKIENIYNTLMNIFRISEQKNISTSQTANDLAEYKLKEKIGKRRGRIALHGVLFNK